MPEADKPGSGAPSEQLRWHSQVSILASTRYWDTDSRKRHRRVSEQQCHEQRLFWNRSGPGESWPVRDRGHASPAGTGDANA